MSDYVHRSSTAIAVLGTWCDSPHLCISGSDVKDWLQNQDHSRLVHAVAGSTQAATLETGSRQVRRVRFSDDVILHGGDENHHDAGTQRPAVNKALDEYYKLLNSAPAPPSHKSPWATTLSALWSRQSLLSLRQPWATRPGCSVDLTATQAARLHVAVTVMLWALPTLFLLLSVPTAVLLIPMVLCLQGRPSPVDCLHVAGALQGALSSPQATAILQQLPWAALASLSDHAWAYASHVAAAPTTTTRAAGNGARPSTMASGYDSAKTMHFVITYAVKAVESGCSEAGRHCRYFQTTSPWAAALILPLWLCLVLLAVALRCRYYSLRTAATAKAQQEETIVQQARELSGRVLSHHEGLVTTVQEAHCVLTRTCEALGIPPPCTDDPAILLHCIQRITQLGV